MFSNYYVIQNLCSINRIQFTIYIQKCSVFSHSCVLPNIYIYMYIYAVILVSLTGCLGELLCGSDANFVNKCVIYRLCSGFSACVQ